MQSASSRIWTRVAVSISYEDNHYATDTSKCFHYKLSETIQLWANYLYYIEVRNKRIISVRLQEVKPFNCVQTNKFWQIV